MNKLRRSYEARVLLVPLAADAERLSAEMAAEGLDGIQTLRPAGQDHYEVGPLATHGWLDAGVVDSVHDTVSGADMVVLLASDLAEVLPSICAEVSSTAQENGVLLAALVVGPEHWDTPSGNTAMASLREAVDMLVIVRGLRLAVPFIDVLRGGARTEPASA